MSTENQATQTSSPSSELVVRSQVGTVEHYSEYKENLRSDFYFSCAYCTMTEVEGMGIRFTIDHYEPQSARPELKNEYSNLLYCCDVCNIRKGDLTPPPAARDAGMRFFRPDTDVRSEHFELKQQRVEGLTEIGTFSKEALDLNRLNLRKLRDLRRRLSDCDKHVAEGVLGLKSFHIDQLPREIRKRGIEAISRLDNMANELASNIDALLKQFAHSDLIDADPEADPRLAEAHRRLKERQALFPGSWRLGRRGPLKGQEPQ